MKLVVFEHSDKGILGDVNFADSLHLGFSFFLFFEQFALSGNITTVTFGGDVFAHRGDRFTGNDLAANSSLNGDDEELLRNDILEFFTKMAT